MNGDLNYARDTRAAILSAWVIYKRGFPGQLWKPEYSWTRLPVCLESEYRHALKLCRTRPQSVLPGMGQQSLLEDVRPPRETRQIKCVCPRGRGGRAGLCEYRGLASNKIQSGSGCVLWG